MHIVAHLERRVENFACTISKDITCDTIFQGIRNLLEYCKLQEVIILISILTIVYMEMKLKSSKKI